MPHKWRIVWCALAASCAFAYGMAARLAYGQTPYAIVNTPALRESLALANHVWRTPCHGVITVRAAHLPDNPGWNTLAYASWTHGRVYTDCEVTLDLDWWTWRPERLATIVLHEVGHLAGMSHSDSPRSVMFHAIVRVDPRARRLFREGRYWQ